MPRVYLGCVVLNTFPPNRRGFNLRIWIKSKPKLDLVLKRTLRLVKLILTTDDRTS